MDFGVECADDAIAAEFLRAQEVSIPRDIEELQQATTSANEEIERVLFSRDRWYAMKEEDQERQPESEELSDEWVDVMLDLEEAFVDENDGALGKRVIELLALDADAFAQCAKEARGILQATSSVALRVYPFMHRLVNLGIASNRVAVVERLSSGDLRKQEKVHHVPVTLRRKTIIGLLRDLDARLPLEQQTDIWSLEIAPELPASLVVSDPFQSGNEDLAAYWRRKVSIEHETYGRDATILSLSEKKTAVVMYELENIIEQSGDPVLKHAAQAIATWLESKQMYYTNPDIRDFELYHLGMENPETLMEIMRSLDVVKHFDPELFFELLGIDPQLGGRSPYFGSFLHKALYNTQRAIGAAAPELGTMAIQTMMQQLLTLDDSVQTYSAVVSQESLKAMQEEMITSVKSAPTTQSKALALMMMAVPYSRMAIDAEVRRQLDALREASPENMADELRRRIDDIEHPLKLAEYIGLLPRTAEQDVRVVKALRSVFGDIRFDAVREQCQKRRPEYLKMLYDRIPLIDETREDLGFAMRVRVAVRDAAAIADLTEEIQTKSTSEKTRAREFLKGVMPVGLYREDFDAVKDQLNFWERNVAERFSYSSRSFEENHGGIVKPTEISLDPRWSEADKAFFVGQALVWWENSARDRRHYFSVNLLRMAEDLRSDLVFLSVVAHPQGKKVAFRYFEKFCDMISLERMLKLLKVNVELGKEFLRQFEIIPSTASRTYLKHLHKQLHYLLGDHREHGALVELLEYQATDGDSAQTLLKKINKTILSGGTPWEIQTGYRSSPPIEIRLDLFDVYQTILESYRRGGFGPPEGEKSVRNPDIDPPDNETLRQMRGCYQGPQTSYGSDEFDTKRFIELARNYFFSGRTESRFATEVMEQNIQSKILR